MQKSLCLIIFLTACHLFPPGVSASNPCFSTLSDTLHIQVPAMSYGGGLYSFSMDYSALGPAGESGVWFRLVPGSLVASTLAGCSYPAPLFIDAGKIILRLPMVLYSGGPLWAEFEVQSSGGQIWLKVTNAGFMPNQAFVTSVKGSGNLGGWADAGGKTGIEAGDAICQARAAAAQLPGTFRAWLSDDTNDAYCRIHNLGGKKSANCSQPTLPASAGPWVRTDGFPFGGNISDIIDRGQVFVPVAADESGMSDGTQWYVTGTSGDGTLSQYGGPRSCNNWTSGGPEMTDGSVSDWTSFAWSSNASMSCDGSLSLLCFQTGPSLPLPPFHLPGKKAFITSVSGNGNLGGWPDAGGLAGISAGDAICRARAGAAGLANAGSFKAWLSDSTTDARDRITSDGPWVRVDGVRVAETKAALTGGLSLFSTVNVTETGLYRGLFDYVWTGTNHTGQKASDTCTGWISSDAGAIASTGRAWDASGWTYSGGYACNGALPLYCFED